MNLEIGQSPFIYGIHEPCPPDVMPQGWILFLAEVGHSLEPHPGIDFTPWASQGYGIICRIHHQFGEGGGSLPLPKDLAGFLQRVASLARNSRGCGRWIAGNECNLPIEWPDGVPLTPEYVAQVYDDCRAIVDGEVILPPVGPWNDQIGYGWMEYFSRMIEACETVEAFALHTYSRGADPASIQSEDKMDPPYDRWHNGFRTYRDWLTVVPERYRHLPTYVTEANQNQSWLDVNSGWVEEAYREIDDWNMKGGQKIRCLVLYRWPRHDKYYIEGKGGVIQDFKDAQRFGYTWQEAPDPPDPPDPPELPVEDKMLKNSSMEGNFTIREAQQVIVADEWEPFYLDNVDPPTGGGSGPVYRPEYKPLFDYVDEHRIKDGTKAQCWFKFQGNMDAGVMQRVAVPAGATVTFSGWVQAWCSNSDDPRVSDAEMYFKFGIDPDGGTNAYSNAVRWDDDWFLVREEYVKRSVSVIANATHVTVFVRAWNKWAMKHNDAYLDACDFEIAGGGIEPPPSNGDVDYERIAKIVQDALNARDRRIASSIP